MLRRRGRRATGYTATSSQDKGFKRSLAFGSIRRTPSAILAPISHCLQSGEAWILETHEHPVICDPHPSRGMLTERDRQSGVLIDAEPRSSCNFAHGYRQDALISSPHDDRSGVSKFEREERCRFGSPGSHTRTYS